MRNPTAILITGASSGIGEALAVHYAKEGRHLYLTGRNKGRLDEVIKACKEKGAKASGKVIDVTDKEAMGTWLTSIDAKTPMDLIIANAGISPGSIRLEELHNSTEQVFTTNVFGVFNTIHPLLGPMRTRGRGQIAIVSSIAGFRGLPNSAPYSGSKVAVRGYGEALRGAVAKYGVEVNIICPGFVESRMTAKNKFKMPFLMTAPRAAQIIAEGLVVNRGLIAFPWQTAWAARLMTLLPFPLADWILRKR